MSATAPPTTVVVVDDEAGIRSVLKRALSRLGYRALDADGAATALALQGTERPAAMICDVLMPEMSGVELVPKALAVDPDVAIIMLTGVDQPQTAVECLRLGAYDYLMKPVDLAELEIALRTALRRRQLEQERRDLEQWLAAEVSNRTREYDERLSEVEAVALDALAAARDWPGRAAAMQRLATALGTAPEDLAAEVARRRA